MTKDDQACSVARHYRHCLVVLLAGVFATFAPRAQEIWLAPQAAPPNTPLHRAADLMDMFEVDAPWKDAASHVTVFQLPASYVGHAPQDEIDRIVADLNRRHIPLALEVGVMNVGPISTNPRCGGFGQVEGYGTPEWAKSIAQKIKTAGGIIQFVAMDEPLFYGHYFKGRPGKQPGCQSSIDIVATLVEAPLNVFLAEFPAIIIGDIEPTDIAEQPAWQQAVSTWASGFRQKMGRRLAFMHLDIPFSHPREERFAVDFYRYVEGLKRQQIIGAIGVIYNGMPSDISDKSWTQDARQHIHLIEDKNGLHPDHVLIQSWTEYPKHALPDSLPGTLTGLVNFYAARVK